MSGLTVGELCAGYGGLGMGVGQVLDTEVAWYSEIDKGALKILEHRFPGVPNIGDMTCVDWGSVPRVDVLTGGTPCQDLSHAGKRAGMTEGTRSNLWVAMREAIAVLRPSLVLWENVGGAYSAEADSEMESRAGRVGDRAGRPALRALGRVLGDLASLGYVGGWHGLRAADVGAPHGRLRVFVVAYPSRDRLLRLCPSRDLNERDAFGDLMLPSAVTLLPTPEAADGSGGRASAEVGGLRPSGAKRAVNLGTVTAPAHAERWGDYADAITRWESLTRPAPEPTMLSRKGTPQLSPAFSEWMMGLPAGWVTGVPGITRNEALHALGNGVVPQQAAAALAQLLAHLESEDA